MKEIFAILFPVIVGFCIVAATAWVVIRYRRNSKPKQYAVVNDLSFFYDNLHLWAGHINIETIGTSLLFPLTLESAFIITNAGEWTKYRPIFKAQDGKVYEKDVLAAISAGCYNQPVKLLGVNGEHMTVAFEGDTITVWLNNPNWVSLSAGYKNFFFNTAAYIDFLRRKGYYVYYNQQKPQP